MDSRFTLTHRKTDGIVGWRLTVAHLCRFVTLILRKVGIAKGDNLSRNAETLVDLSLLMDPDFIDDCFMTTMLPFLASDQIAVENSMTFATPALFPEDDLISSALPA